MTPFQKKIYDEINENNDVISFAKQNLVQQYKNYQIYNVFDDDEILPLNDWIKEYYKGVGHDIINEFGNDIDALNTEQINELADMFDKMIINNTELLNSVTNDLNNDPEISVIDNDTLDNNIDEAQEEISVSDTRDENDLDNISEDRNVDNNNSIDFNFDEEPEIEDENNSDIIEENELVDFDFDRGDS